MTKLAPQELVPTIVTETNGLYRLQPDVILVLQDGVARILGLNRGRFYGLDAMGTRMLTLLLEQGPEVAAFHLAAEYGVPESQVLADVNKLLHDLQRQQILVYHPPQLYHPVPPSHFTTSLLLTLAWISIL
jgi:Coenzyme PQQ synthesis protein D (PqqD)